MNPIEFLIANLINVLLSCSALPATEQVIGGENFRVLSWVCQADQGPMVIRTWMGECTTGHTSYWGRPFYLLFEEDQAAMYITRFGEIQVGQGAQLQDAYQAPCGS